MSIASEISRLQGIKADIRVSLVNKGITSASTHDMADFSTDIDNISGGGGTPQIKTVTPSTSQQIVTPDAGYVLSQVTVNAIPVTRELNAAGGYTVTIG